MEGDTYKFNIKFDKADHAIDAETYAKSLLAMTSVMTEVNYQSKSNHNINIDVTAQSPGSFDVELVIRAVKDLFSDESVQYLSGLVTIVGGLFGLRKIWHKADQEKTETNGDQVSIKNTNGDVMYKTTTNIYNIYMSNQAIQDSLTDNFRALEKDETVQGFEINHEGETTRVDRDEFHEMAKPVQVQLPDQDIVEVPASLVIVKLVFEGSNRKWDFLYNGTKISATIQDKDFWSQIDNGKSFAKGDTMVATLRIIRRYDPTVGAFINDDYQVINIRGHNPRGERQQAGFDFGF